MLGGNDFRKSCGTGPVFGGSSTVYMTYIGFVAYGYGF